jgi:hydrophobe/amphiphile efflux-3 (HAE3) family protein
VETDLKNWLPKGHPEVEYYEEIRDIFTLTNRVLICISHEGSGGIFNPTTLELVTHLTDEVKGLEGVIQEDVVSLSTQDNIIGVAGGLEVIPFMEEVPKTPEALESLRDAVHDNDMYYGTLVSKDGRGTLILAKFVTGIDKVLLYRQVHDLVEKMRNRYPDEGIYYAGRPILEAVLYEEIMDDMRVMLPIVIVAVLVLLALTMRTMRGVVLPFLTVIASVIWSLGLMGLTQSPLYSMSTTIPVILTAVGCAYGIHIISRYYEAVENNEARRRRDIVMETMMEMRVPVIMTALTTVVGFLSMTVSHSLPPRSVGFFTAFGVAAATLASLTLIPAGLVLMQRVRPISIIPFFTRSKSRPLDRVFSGLGLVIYRQKRWVFVFALLVVAVSIAATSRVHIREGLTANMRLESETMRADTFLNEKFGGTTLFNIIIEGSEPDSIKSPDLLRRVDALQAHAEQHVLVGDSLSIAEYLKRMNKVMNEDQEEFSRVPESRDLIAQYLLLYSMSGDPDDFDDVVDYDYQKANVSVYMKSDLGDNIGSVFLYLQPRVQELFSDRAYDIIISGSAKMTMLIVNNVIRDQLRSFLVAIVAVFFITAAMFRSARIGLITIVPISIACLANFGIMGMTGVPLQVATTFSACVGIGIGIDYTIHFFAKYRLLMARGHTGAEVTIHTMQTSGRAIFFNAVVVAFGFLMLLWSNSPPNRNLGILIALNMATSFVGAMTVLPAILSFVPLRWIVRDTRRSQA